MYQDVLINKALKEATDTIYIMSTRVSKPQNVADATQVEEVVAPVQNEETVNEEVQDVEIQDDTEETTDLSDSIFGSIIAAKEEAGEVVKSREDIIKECLADSKHFVMKKNLHIRNVVATTRISSDTGEMTTRLAFNIKEKVFGIEYDNTQLDAFGRPTSKLGLTSIVTSSTYAISGLMKDTPKSALFAGNVARMLAVPNGGVEAVVSDNDNIVNKLYAGGTMDVLIQYVPANTTVVNPFGNSSSTKVYDHDVFIHHVVRLNFGEVGNDVYVATINK